MILSTSMGIPIGSTHTVTKELRVRGELRCEYCGYAAVVTLIVPGAGTGLNPLFLDKVGAVQRAEARALEDAREHAGQVAALVPCPSCGRPDSQAVDAIKASVRLMWAKALACGAIASAAFWLSGRSTAVLTIVVGVGVAAVCYSTLRRRVALLASHARDARLQELDVEVSDPGETPAEIDACPHCGETNQFRSLKDVRVCGSCGRSSPREAERQVEQAPRFRMLD